MSFTFPNYELTTLLDLNENIQFADSICDYLNRVTTSSKFTHDSVPDAGALTKRILKDDICICSWSFVNWEPLDKLYDRILKTIKREELLFKLELL